jgi:HEAT repeat protein
VGQFGSQAAEAVPVLIPLVKEGPINLRRKAVVALGKIGPEARGAVPALREILAKESEKLLVCFAIRTLGSIGKDAKEALPDLIARSKSDQILEVRLAAIEQLGIIGPDAKDAVGILTQAQKDGRAEIRDAATEALKRIQPMP